MATSAVITVLNNTIYANDELHPGIRGELLRHIFSALAYAFCLLPPTLLTSLICNWEAVYRVCSPSSQQSTSGNKSDRVRRASNSFSQQRDSKKSRLGTPNGDDGSAGEGGNDGHWGGQQPAGPGESINHQNSEKYPCPLSLKLPLKCQDEFETKFEAIEHAFSKHKFCGVCKHRKVDMAGGRTELEVVKDIFFNKFVDLKNHVLNCHAKLIPCPYGKCDKKFGLSNKLSRHVEKKHPRNNVVMMDKEQARRQDWLNAQKKTQTTELALFTDICKSGNMVTLNRLVVNMSNDRNVSSDSATVTELESRADGGPSSISRLVAEEARLVIPTSYITPPQTISSIEKERAVRHIGTRDNLQTMPSLINVTVRPQDLYDPDGLNINQGFSELDNAISDLSVQYIGASREARIMAMKANPLFILEFHKAIAENLDEIKAVAATATDDGYYSTMHSAPYHHHLQEQHLRQNHYSRSSQVEYPPTHTLPADQNDNDDLGSLDILFEYTHQRDLVSDDLSSVMLNRHMIVNPMEAPDRHEANIAIKEGRVQIGENMVDRRRKERQIRE